MKGAAAVWASTRTRPSRRKTTKSGNIHHFRLVFKKSQKSAKKPGSEASRSRSSFSVTGSGCSMIDSLGGTGGDRGLALVLAEITDHVPRLVLGLPVAGEGGTAAGEGVAAGDAEEQRHRGHQAVVDQAQQDRADGMPDRPSQRTG